MNVFFVLRTLCLLLVFSVLPLAMPCGARAEGAGDCPRAIGEAIDSSDLPGFERLVDMDALLNDALALFLVEVRKPENANAIPPMISLMLSQLAGGGSENVRRLLLSESRAFVENGISSGAFAGKKPAGGTAHGLLAPLFADASQGRKQICNVGDGRPDGGDTLVPFVVRDGGNGLEYPVLGRIRRVDGADRLVKVENMQELLSRILKECRELQE